MNILILEDNDERISQFKDKFSNHNLDIVKTSDDCITKLKNNKIYDYIFLDHDLGEKQGVDSDKENTGYQVALKMGIEDIFPNYKVVIHSLNPVGANNMIKCFPENIDWDGKMNIQILKKNYFSK